MVNTTYDVGSGPFFDGGVLVRLAGGLYAGAAVSAFMKQDNGDIASTIPHPFFYNTPRSVAGAAENLERRELVTHVQAAYVISARNKLDIAISVGPSWFHVTQDLVTDMTFSERYPYDTATFTAASTAAVSRQQARRQCRRGRSVQAVEERGNRRAGSLLTHDGRVSVAERADEPKSDAGGLQAGGGLRLYF